MNPKRPAIFFIIALFSLAGTALAADTWLVDDDGVQCPARDFVTFADAYGTAAPGDTIELCSGTYVLDNFVIDKQLTIIGPQQNVDPRWGRSGAEAIFTTPTGAEDIFFVQAQVEFNGVKLKDGYYGVRTVGAGGHNFQFKYCIMENIYRGIWFDQDSSNAYIYRNRLAGNPDEFYSTILFFDGSGHTHIGNRIINNHLLDTLWGYGFFTGADALLDDFLFEGNLFEGNDVGLFSQNLSNSDILNNCFKNNGYAGLRAAMHNVTVADNYFQNNQVYAIEEPEGSGIYYAFGIDILDDGYGNPISNDVVIGNNTVADEIYGVVNRPNNDTPSILLSGNCIGGNEVGVTSLDAGDALAAMSNWWDAGDGPNHATSWLYLGNPYGPHPGSGDPVSDYVLYDGYLTSQPVCAVCPGQPTPIELSSFEAVEVDGEVLIAWITETELDNAGFHLWVASNNQGNYRRLTEELIPAEGNEFSGAAYELIDTDVAPGETYYYKLEDISLEGESTFHGPTTVTLKEEPRFGCGD